MNVMFAFLGWPEIIAILAVVLLLFGAKKLPELARGLGGGIREFKKASREIQDEIESAVEEPPPRKPSPPAQPTQSQSNPPSQNNNA